MKFMDIKAATYTVALGAPLYFSAGSLAISCLAPNQVFRIDPNRQVELLDDCEAHELPNPTNVAFGGLDFDQLFATNLGRWHLTRIDLGIPGAPLACHQ